MSYNAGNRPFVQGEAVQLEVTIVDENDEPVTDDISSYEFRCTIVRDVALSDTILVKEGADITVNNTEKTVTVAFTSEETKDLLGWYDFDLFRIDSGSESQHTYGKFQVKQGATKFA